MEEIVRKGKRLCRPKSVSVDLRPEVYEFYDGLSDLYHVGLSLFIRGVLEDFYDSHKDPLPEEVSQNE